MAILAWGKFKCKEQSEEMNKRVQASHFGTCQGESSSLLTSFPKIGMGIMGLWWVVRVGGGLYEEPRGRQKESTQHM